MSEEKKQTKYRYSVTIHAAYDASKIKDATKEIRKRLAKLRRKAKKL